MTPELNTLFKNIEELLQIELRKKAIDTLLCGVKLQDKIYGKIYYYNSETNDIFEDDNGKKDLNVSINFILNNEFEIVE